jgi:phenylacetate-CoA ligase
MPFLRYEIGDVGQLGNAPCACGRGLHRLLRIEGRVLDVLRTPSGAIVPGEFFPHILKDVPEVIEFQVEQKRLDHILLSLVLSEDLSSRSRALLDSEIRRWFGDNSIVELKRVESIPRRASGKRRVTIGLGQD